MAKFITAKWENREAVTARLNSLLPELNGKLAEMQFAMVNELATAIKPRAPSRTGRYRASIEGDLLANNPNKGKRSPVAAQTKDKNATGIYANYIWRFLEFGTQHMAARPHMMPTYRAKRKNFRRRLANTVNRAVRKAMKGQG